MLTAFGAVAYYWPKPVKMASSEQKTKEKKLKKYYSKYKENFHEEWPCIRKSSKSENHAFCVIRSTDVSVKSGEETYFGT